MIFWLKYKICVYNKICDKNFIKEIRGYKIIHFQEIKIYNYKNVFATGKGTDKNQIA